MQLQWRQSDGLYCEHSCQVQGNVSERLLQHLCLFFLTHICFHSRIEEAKENTPDSGNSEGIRISS